MQKKPAPHQEVVSQPYCLPPVKLNSPSPVGEKAYWFISARDRRGHLCRLHPPRRRRHDPRPHRHNLPS